MRLLVLLALVLAIVACASVSLPAAPNAPLLSDTRLGCSFDTVLYVHSYDVNPATQAGVLVIGQSNPSHSHEPAFLVIQIADDGTFTAHLAVGRKVVTYTQAEWEARYGVGLRSACTAFPREARL